MGVANDDDDVDDDVDDDGGGEYEEEDEDEYEDEDDEDDDDDDDDDDAFATGAPSGTLHATSSRVPHFGPFFFMKPLQHWRLPPG